MVKPTSIQPLTLLTVDTPCLILNVSQMERNIQRLKAHLATLGVVSRPHLKTAKSIEVARRMMSSDAGPATVSTIKEAENFAAAGVQDLIYAVGIEPAKIERVVALRKSGVDLAILLDSLEQASFVVEASQKAGLALATLIEIDCDGHRSGVQADDQQTLVAIAKILVEGGAELRGVLTHAGGSYALSSQAELEKFAEKERAAVVKAAMTLGAANLPCPVVSVGSTPTALACINLNGVTEVRAGVFVFFDLVMAGMGVCAIDDIALSVLGTVIGHQVQKGWILIDAGWMAMSRDRGTGEQDIDQGYGLVCDIEGKPMEDLIVIDANQEHGIVALRMGSKAKLPDLPIGMRLRILPNHACSTAAQHNSYYVVGDGSKVIEANWARFGGW